MSKNFTPFIYSPKPASSYYLAHSNKGVCCARTALGFKEGAAIFNFLWLSCPSLDDMNLSNEGWRLENDRMATKLFHIAKEVRGDKTLDGYLVKDPATFLAWWLNETPDIWNVYYEMGQTVEECDAWVRTVTLRARAAAQRMFGGGGGMARLANVAEKGVGRVVIENVGISV
jgi:hypothetical protein